MTRAVRILILAMLAAVNLNGAEPAFQVEIPGFGLFEEDGTFLEATQTELGGRIEALLAAGGPDVPMFIVVWDAEGWTQVSFDTFSFDAMVQRALRTEFSPFGEEGGGIFQGNLTLPPTEKHDGKYNFSIWTDSFACSNPDGSKCAGMYVLEYSIIEVEAPIPGDFNYDDSVDFSDFLILSSNFEKFPQTSAHWSWRDGDATLDERVNFDDFLILSANFGAMREPQVAAVPEPSTFVLLGTAVLYDLLIGRRRRLVRGLFGP